MEARVNDGFDTQLTVIMLVCCTTSTLSFAISRDLEPEKPTGRRTTYKTGFYREKKLFSLGYSIFYTANILENFRVSSPKRLNLGIFLWVFESRNPSLFNNTLDSITELISLIMVRRHF